MEIKKWTKVAATWLKNMSEGLFVASAATKWPQKGMQL